MNTIKEVTSDDFQSEVLESDIPVVVDFWAPWCGPCRMVAPVLETVAKTLNGQIKFVKLNTDENIQTAQAYSISAIPSMIVFKDGEEVERIIGFKPQDVLENQLRTHLSS